MRISSFIIASISFTQKEIKENTDRHRHDWSDDYCVEILSKIKTAMHPSSRILICDQVVNTTAGFPNSISSAPEPLSANYGYFTRYSHQRDITMMSIINGIERTPVEFQNIIERAGLVMSKIYDCRSPVSLVECPARANYQWRPLAAFEEPRQYILSTFLTSGGCKDALDGIHV